MKMIPSEILIPILVLLSACWGSFLNVVACRLVRNHSIAFPPSHCTHCSVPLAWYDMIPLISWIWLKGKCRHCSCPISFLYLLIECIAAIVFPLLWFWTNSDYFIAYALFFSALIITIRTDLEYMLISRYATTFLVPTGIGAAYAGLLPISSRESIFGALIGFFFLWSIATLFKWLTKKEGMGAGDFDLIALIGSYTGIIGVWLTILIGSTLGSLVGLFCLIVLKKDRSLKLPFGPFLAVAAMLYVLYGKEIVAWLQI